MSRFAEVSLFSLVHDADEEQRARDVPFAAKVETFRVPRVRALASGVVSLLSNRPLTHALLGVEQTWPILQRQAATVSADLVVSFCSGVAPFALRQPLADLPLVLDLVDVDSVKWSNLAARSGTFRKWIYRREAQALGAFERVVTRQAALSLVVNQREKNLLLSTAPEARVEVVENGVDLENFHPHDPPVDSPTVIFCGVMDYGPNVDGVRWFAEEIWPAVRTAVPAARFIVVGSSPAETIKRLAQVDQSITVTGAVDRVQPYLWQAAVSVAPLRVAQGLQNKVLEALAAGLPVVATSAVAEGLPAAAMPGCAIADDAVAFSSAVIHLLSAGPAQRRAVAMGADLTSLSWDERLGRVESLCQLALVSRSAK